MTIAQVIIFVALCLPLSISSACEACGGHIDIVEDTAIDMVSSLPQIEELREANPDVRVVFAVEERPEENGRWAIKAMTDQGTHYSNVGIFYVYPGTGEITRMDPVTGDEIRLGE
jgi:hypothetical protein